MDMGQCDPEIYEHGTPIFTTHTVPAEFIEQWVKEVERTSGQRVDWHYFAGYAIIKTTGDVGLVKDAIAKHWRELKRAMRKTYVNQGLEDLFSDDTFIGKYL